MLLVPSGQGPRVLLNILQGSALHNRELSDLRHLQCEAEKPRSEDYYFSGSRRGRDGVIFR